jgi:RNA polymerase sigma-70 factor (ECF subfamily)
MVNPILPLDPTTPDDDATTRERKMANALLPLTRQSLIGLLQQSQGDQAARNQARGQFYESYAPVILRWCLGSGLQRADAEEVTQDVVLKLFDAIKSYRPEKGRFRCWLKTVVHNAVVDTLRRSAQRPRNLDNGRLDQVLSPASLADLERNLDEALPPHFVLAQEVKARVLERISPRAWELFERHKVNGETAAEVARDLGISEGSVYTAANRIVRMWEEETAKFLQTEPE